MKYSQPATTGGYIDHVRVFYSGLHNLKHKHYFIRCYFEIITVSARIAVCVFFFSKLTYLNLTP